MNRPDLCLDWYSQGGNSEIPAPNLCIVLLTYERTDMAIRTIRGVLTNLDYPEELISWYVADDGSKSSHMEAIFRELQGHNLTGWHNQKYQGGTSFCGKGWNIGLMKAHQQSDYVLWLEDDWVLRTKMDIRPYMLMLMERQEVGICRLSGLTTDNILKVCAHRGTHYFDYLRSAPFCYSGNPHIRHVRFSEYYGVFAIDQTPGDIEVFYDIKYHQMKDGPSIWRPCDIPAWGIFGHIGNERTW